MGARTEQNTEWAGQQIELWQRIHRSSQRHETALTITSVESEHASFGAGANVAFEPAALVRACVVRC